MSAQDAQLARASSESIREKLSAAVLKLEAEGGADRAAALTELRECVEKLNEVIKLLGEQKDTVTNGQGAPAPAQQGLFGSNKGLFGLGGAGSPLTLEQLNGDLDGGLNFFKNAYLKFSQALLTAEQSQEVKARLEVAGGNERAAALGVLKECGSQLDEAIKLRIQQHTMLTEDENRLIGEGRAEVGKGIAKWTAIGAAISLTALKKPEAAVAAALPAASELLRDLPLIVKTIGMVDKLNEVNKGKRETNEN